MRIRRVPTVENVEMRGKVTFTVPLRVEIAEKGTVIFRVGARGAWGEPVRMRQGEEARLVIPVEFIE